MIKLNWQFTTTILILLGIGLSVYLWDKQVTTAPGACFAGGCDDVLTSDDAKILGQPIAFYGILYFLALLAMNLFELIQTRSRFSRIIWSFLLLGGLGFVIYLRYLEFFVIGSICSLCWLVMLVLLLITVVFALEERLWVISIKYRLFLKPILFRIDPERVHDFFLKFGKFCGSRPLLRRIVAWMFAYRDPRLEQKIAGVTYKNPVGLSAGFDKDAELADILGATGFGHAELGSTTWGNYPGNEGKRLTRLPKLKSIAVNFGLKSSGVKKFLDNLANARYKDLAVMASVARTNGTGESGIDEAIADYCRTLELVDRSDDVAAISINISCPNATTGELFTTSQNLKKLLAAVSKLELKKPIYLKLPLASSWVELESLLQVIVDSEVDAKGVILSNLQKDRSKLEDKVDPAIKGGLSGLPTQQQSDELILKTYRKYGDKLIIIGVGGIFSAKDAYSKIKNGASLVLLITGMVYEGPQLITTINRELSELIQKDGYKNISEAIGAAAK